MKLSLLILTIATTLSLAGCKTTGKVGDFITIKPSRAQIEAAAREVVCGSFEPLTFSQRGDTRETVSGIREHNAAYGTYDCGGLK